MQTHYGQYQQQYSQQRSLRKQSPALETPLPEFVPPQGQRGQDIMIIWDFQNVRTPTELEPVEIIRFMYDTFVKQPGPRRCAGAFCTFTDNTKKAVGEKRFNQFCSNGVLNFMMINSPGGPRKADDSDHPLKEMMMNFTVDCVRGSKDGVLLLITADADFVRPAIWCKQQGCVSLELIYYGPIASREIRELEANWKMEWRDFLDCMMGRRCAWTFPYPQDVAAGLVPSGSSGNSGGYNSSYNSNGGGSGYQQDGHRRLHPAAHRIQQQQQHQLHLPGPPQRLALPPPPAAAGARQGYPAGTATVAAPAVTVSTTHVEQAAEQLLHNPAALQQVMQQYKQSMQTTAVLQQVLQGVAQKATTGATATVPVGNAAAAQAQAQAQAAFMRANMAQQQQQQARTVPAANGGPFVMQANKPVTILRRDAAPGAGAAAAAVPAAGAGAGLTWQQREQAASSRLPPDTGSGVKGPGASGGRSPPPPEWWDPSAAAAGRGRRNSKSSVGGGGGGGAGTGSFSRHGSSNGNWGAAAGADSEGNVSSEGDDTGFWDSSAPGQGAEVSSLGAANRSGSSGRLNLAGSSSGSRAQGQGQDAGSSGDGAVLSPPAGTGLPPPLPSMGLMKRAAGTVGAGGGGSKAGGSGGNLAALLAAAAAGAGSPTKPSGRTGPGQQSPLHQHKHHGSLGSEQGLLSPADKHEMHHQQALAAAKGGAEGGFMQPQRPQQQQVFVGLDQMRSPSPGLSSSRSDRDRPQQQQPTQVDRHMQHHEQQLLLAMQRNNKQRPFHEAADAGTSSALERPSAVPLNLFGGRASGSSCGDNSPQEHTGLWARPKGGAADPGMAAAARILSRATAQAAADASKAHGTGSHDGASWASGGRVDVGSEGLGDAGGRRSSNSGGGVEIVEAPPLPPWMQQPQQQDVAAESPRQRQQQHQDDAGAFSGAVVYEEVVDEETGEVILVPKKQQRTPPAQQQQQQHPGAAYGSSEPVSIAAAAAAQAASGADADASSEGIVTPSNTPCSGIGSLPMAAAAAGLARLSLGGGSNSSQGRSRLHGWQHPTAPADGEADAVSGASAAEAAEAAAESTSGLFGSADAAQMPGEGEGLAEDAGSCAGDDSKLVSVTISTAGSLSSTAGCAEVSAGGDGERLVQLLLEVCTAPSRNGSGAMGATAAAAGLAAAAVAVGDSSSSSGEGADADLDVSNEDAAELMAPLLGTFEGAEGITADDDQDEFVTADCNVGVDVSAAFPAPSSAMLGQSAAETLFPLSTGLEALVALSQGFVSSAPHSAGFAGLGAGAPGMLPLPATLGVGRGPGVGGSRGLDGLTLLGPVVNVAGAAAAARGSSGSSPHHRPKQPSIAEQLQELQHILSAEMAAEAAAVGIDEGECNGQGSDAGSTAVGEGDSALDEPISAAAVSAEGSEGGTTEEGLGFEAVGLDGLPVYGPHLPPPNSNSEDDNTDDAELLRLLGHAPVAHHHQQQQRPQQGLDDAGDNDISVERMLQLLSIGTQPVPHSTPLVVSAPPMPLRNLSGSPVTAIEELGNVTSPSSAGSRTDGRTAAAAAAADESKRSA